MSDYEFELPWPPTVNHYHTPIRTRGGVRVIKSEKVKAYHRSVKVIMDNLGLSGEKISDKVLICVTMHHKTNRKYDCSNFLKAYEDALVQCGFIEDDHLIEYSGIKKGEKIQGGCIKVSVNVIKEQ